MRAMQRAALRASYGLTQAARVGWYTSQSLAGRRLVADVGRTLPPVAPPTVEAPAGVPGRAVLLRHVRHLFLRDLANVEAGLYPMPRDEPDGVTGLLRQRRLYLRDLPEVVRRRALHAHQEVAAGQALRPPYYLQNFHFQTDGWMSAESARLYETQVETLFLGAAAAMRRQALVPIAAAARSRDQRSLRMLDVASGSGAFLRDVRRAFPRLAVVATDLSEPYLALARKELAPRRGGAVACAGEALAFADAAFDLVSAVYLLHELPPAVRPLVAAEMARVAAPGARIVVVDSLQPGDTPQLDGLLEIFPQLFHEPYYRSYLTCDVERLFGCQGLVLESAWPAFVSKVFVFRKH